MNDPRSAPLAPPASHWPLRPSDLAPEHAALPELHGIEDQAVFRVLVFEAHRRRRVRAAAIFLYGGAWVVLASGYLSGVLGLPPAAAVTCAAALAVGVLAIVAQLFLFAGIEGYESTLRLLHWSGDLALSRTGPREIATGVWARTFAHRSPRAIARAHAAGVVLLLALGVAIDRVGPVFEPNWCLAGAAGALCAGWAALPDLPSIALPGTLLWTRGVRRGVERRLRGVPPRPPLRRAVSWCIGIAVGVAILGIPTAYLMTGTLLRFHYLPWFSAPVTRRLSLLAVLLADAGIGLAVGRAWGIWTRRARPRLLEALERDLGAILEARGELAFERPGGRG